MVRIRLQFLPSQDTEHRTLFVKKRRFIVCTEKDHIRRIRTAKSRTTLEVIFAATLLPDDLPPVQPVQDHRYDNILTFETPL